MTEETLQQFIQYQFNIPTRNKTKKKNIAFIKWFLRWANNKGYYNGKLHNTYRPKLKGTDGNSKEVIHLTWDELQHLYHFKIPDEKQYLARVRDVFCFCCFTSLRYSDVAKLCRSDVKDTYISVVTQKTVDGLKIELNDYSRAILERYKPYQYENGGCQQPENE
jgi:integrase